MGNYSRHNKMYTGGSKDYDKHQSSHIVHTQYKAGIHRGKIL